MTLLKCFILLFALSASAHAIPFEEMSRNNNPRDALQLSGDTPTQTLWGHMIETLQKGLQADFEQPLRIRPVSRKWEADTKTFSNFEIESTHFDPRDKRITAKIIFYDNLKTPHPFQFQGTVTFLKRVPLFKESLSAGQECKPEDLRWQMLEEDYRLKDVIMDPEVLRGAIVKKTIHSGDMPTWKNLKTCDAIDRGELVELIYKTKNLTITLAGGRALNKGRTGDTISVLMPMTSKKGKSLFGVIEKNRRIRINTLG